MELLVLLIAECFFGLAANSQTVTHSHGNVHRTSRMLEPYLSRFQVRNFSMGAIA